MGITPNVALDKASFPRHYHRHNGGSCCSRCCSGRGRSHNCGRTCHFRRCWCHCWWWWWPRFPWWRRAAALLYGAAILSCVIPGAPLARWLLSEDAERQRLLTENEFRLQRSQHFMEDFRAGRRNEKDPAVTKDESPPLPVVPDVGVTVLTMARGRRMTGSVGYRTEYLTQSVATMLHLLNDTSLRRTYAFHVCNIDDKPDLFHEALSLEDVLPVFKRYGGSSSSFSSSVLGSESSPPAEKAKKPIIAPATIWEKLKKDYVYCMQQTLALGVRYVLLVEDDAVAHADLFRVLEHVLEHVVEAPGASPVAYLKLYHPRRLLGYLSLEVERLSELLALSLTLGALLLTCCGGGGLLLGGGGRGGGGGGGGGEQGGGERGGGLRWTSLLHYDPTNIGGGGVSRTKVVVRWLGWSLVVAVLALAIGRTNLLELRRLASPHLYQVTPTPSCCIPAVLYPRQGAEDFSSFLSNVTCTARRSTDIVMDTFREMVEQQHPGRRALLVQPNLFHHIGLVSSLRRKEVNPLVVQ